jgi:hypothetical protein
VPHRTSSDVNLPICFFLPLLLARANPDKRKNAGKPPLRASRRCLDSTVCLAVAGRNRAAVAAAWLLSGKEFHLPRDHALN